MIVPSPPPPPPRTAIICPGPVFLEQAAFASHQKVPLAHIRITIHIQNLSQWQVGNSVELAFL